MIARRLSKQLALVVCACLVFQLAACGTIIYPERRGQTSGQIDPAIAILDAIGLVFFIIPGLLAFAIDFATGAIYLPAGRNASERVDELRDRLNSRVELQGDRIVVYLDPQELTPERVETLVQEINGEQVRFDGERLEAYRYNDRTELPTAFAHLVRKTEWPAMAAL